MNSLAKRRDRIVKIRTIERLMAELELARSGRELQRISGLEKRIAALRAASCGSGVHQGTTLQASCEMAERLDSARNATEISLATAAAHHHGRKTKFVFARQRESGAEKLALAASQGAAIARENRENAAGALRTKYDPERETS
jgi:hypothetical protein